MIARPPLAGHRRSPRCPAKDHLQRRPRQHRRRVGGGTEAPRLL